MRAKRLWEICETTMRIAPISEDRPNWKRSVMAFSTTAKTINRTKSLKGKGRKSLPWADALEAALVLESDRFQNLGVKISISGKAFSNLLNRKGQNKGLSCSSAFWSTSQTHSWSCQHSMGSKGQRCYSYCFSLKGWETSNVPWEESFYRHTGFFSSRKSDRRCTIPFSERGKHAERLWD